VWYSVSSASEVIRHTRAIQILLLLQLLLLLLLLLLYISLQNQYIAMLHTGIGIGIARGQYYWILIGCLAWYHSNPVKSACTLTALI